MSNIDSNILCPVCHGLLSPTVLSCGHCDIRVEGPFQLNEFATLSPEDLHFLRIFIRCEGRVRDMEPALGLSYPTIRNRLTQLKNKLVGEYEERAKGEPPKPLTTEEVLTRLEKGEITFDEAMALIKTTKGS
ncbi:DUF2089 domain-containing protein [Bdellovibrio sp. NC01]|uniref:DUF2089 domain-containing protein n=1 Tax=Bdellovibrio sp. NC01 TaxID=2220073 RepID=UPI0011573577|nr:DUF2089 domain-containing protein [Bdellovibrio sp. NC01]QDK38557.1 hypothetical protein DOE51_13705 [Bdellovibrio sp. NC01]